MSLVPTIYKSTDSGAPTLNGTVGSLTSVLDAVLVNGYGSGGSAKAGAGWTLEYTGTNKRAYRNNYSTGSGGYLRVDDAATSPGNARHAWLRAYESMTDVDSGTGVTPTTTQLTSGVILPKSSTLDSTARAWMIIATEKWFYFFVNINSATSYSFTGVPYSPIFVGDFVSVKAGDNFNFMISGSLQTSYTGSSGTSAVGALYSASHLSEASANYGWALRSYSGVSGAVVCGAVKVSSTDGLYGYTGTYPNPVTNGLLISKIPIKEVAAVSFRGYFPNIYAPLHKEPFAEGTVLSDVDGLPSATELLAKRYSFLWGNPSSSDTGEVLFDITNEW